MQGERAGWLTIVTATYNASAFLPALMSDLIAQSDQRFLWVVMDGGSEDGTLDLVRQFPADRLHLRSEPDFGVYDALNKAVRSVATDFYLVMGADDRIAPDAVGRYLDAIRESGADIISASVQAGGRVFAPCRGSRWLIGGNAFVSSHSVGCVIRRSLHDSAGLYSNMFVNAADMYFISRAVDHGARVHAAAFVAGQFGQHGMSTANHVCSVTEAYRIQLIAGFNRWVQTAILVFRLVRAHFRGHS